MIKENPYKFSNQKRNFKMIQEHRIIAIGGGEIGRTGYPVETTAIDEEIVRVSGKIRPKLLFIPTATSDSQVYIDAAERHFGGTLGCKVDSLCLIRDNLSENEIRDKIDSADIIYVGGGSTDLMLDVWEKYNVGQLLKEASGEKVLSGLSAGAICWGIKTDGTVHECLELVDLYFCPHYDERKEKFAGKSERFKQFLKDKTSVGIGLGDLSAFEVTGDKFRIIAGDDKAAAYAVFWENGVCREVRLVADGQFRDMSNLKYL
jgi:dipeptidase E